MTTSNLCKYLVIGLIVVLISITLFVTPNTNKPCVNCDKPSPSAPPSAPLDTNEADKQPPKPRPKLKQKPKAKSETEQKKVEFNTQNNDVISGYDGSDGLASW